MSFSIGDSIIELVRSIGEPKSLVKLDLKLPQISVLLASIEKFMNLMHVFLKMHLSI